MQAIHENKKYDFDICGHQSTTPGSLKVHKQAIHENKKYDCDICGHQFTDKGHLKRHNQAIHENKKYDCDICVLSCLILPQLFPIP